MAMPKFKNEHIIEALKYIDENGVPFHNQSTKYELVTDDGKRYPPKYVVAVADHLANGADISTDGFNAVEAKSFLEGQGFTIETKQQEKFELSITATSIASTDERFTMDNISLGDNYKPLDVCFKKATGEVIRHTIEFIKRKPYGNKLLIKVKDEVKLVIDATPGYEPYDRQKIIEQNKKNTVRHAYFREYLALQRLCLLILRHQKHQIGTGSRQIYGILFDGAWLWEEYIDSLVEDVFFHSMNKGGKGA